MVRSALLPDDSISMAISWKGGLRDNIEIRNADSENDGANVMISWIKCSDRVPDNKNGLWSDEVAAVSDIGCVFKLSCMNGYWQRTREFIDSGSSSITHWQPLPAPPEE